MHYFLNIGSNLGNRKLNISRALRALESKFGYFEVSKIMESEPWGYESANPFMNIAVMVVSDITPEEMLMEIKEIESQLGSTIHRTPEGSYCDRVVDVDIMAIDEMIINTDKLTVPHRDLAKRRFFLQPFSELAPVWRDPRNGLTCEEMIESLEEKEKSED